MNPYEILGVSPEANRQDVKAAFRRLAKDCHPDVRPGDSAAEQRFKDLKAAYESALAKAGERIQPGAAGWKSRERAAVRRNARRSVSVSVEEAVRGTSVRLDGAGPCKGCAGAGHLRSRHPVVCDTCGGSGISGYKERGIIRVKLTCPDCAGSGRSTRIRCVECGGFGTSPLSDLDFSVPPGCRDGDTFTIAGGASDKEGNAVGDLEIVVRVVSGEAFRVAGDDIETDVAVETWEAVLGAEKNVRAPDGRHFKLSVPAGSRPGRRFRLKGQGFTGDGGRGDFVVILAVVLPDSADPRVRQAYETLRDTLSNQVA